MDSFDFFLTLAEIAVALAGFASVVVVFSRREDGSWEPADVARLRGMLSQGLFAAFFSVLPVALYQAGISARIAWSASSFALACWLTATALIIFRQNRFLPAESYSKPLQSSMVASMALAALLLVLNTFGLGLERGPGAYIFAVVLMLAISGALFMRLVLLPFRR